SNSRGDALGDRREAGDLVRHSITRDPEIAARDAAARVDSDPAEPELSAIDRAPAVHVAARRSRAGVTVATRDLRDLRAPDHRRWRRVREVVEREPERPVSVVAPTRDGAARERAGVAVADREAGDRAEPGDLLRGRVARDAAADLVRGRAAPCGMSELTR